MGIYDQLENLNQNQKFTAVAGRERPQPEPALPRPTQKPRNPVSQTSVQTASGTAVKTDDPPSASVGDTPSRQKSSGPEALVSATIIETLRKAVREPGKERTDVGFSKSEKDALRDLAYTFTRNGQRTTINDIVRIAVNWLIHDYTAQAHKNILSKIVEALHR
jgi:hypothetical protein